MEQVEAGENMPPDLRGKMYIDLNSAKIADACAPLVAKINPQKAKRQDFLQKIKNDTFTQNRLMEYLKGEASANDQTVQNTLLSALAKFNNTESAREVFLRMISSWGVGTIKRCIKLCASFDDETALLMLCSSLPIDHRFVFEKTQALLKVLDRANDGSAELLTDRLSNREIRNGPDSHMDSLAICDILAASAGCVNTPGFFEGLTIGSLIEDASVPISLPEEMAPNDEQIENAVLKFRSRLPAALPALLCYTKIPFYVTTHIWKETECTEDTFQFWVYSDISLILRSRSRRCHDDFGR